MANIKHEMPSFGKKLCEKLNLDPEYVASLTIHMDINYATTINVRMYIKSDIDNDLRQEIMEKTYEINEVL